MSKDEEKGTELQNFRQQYPTQMKEGAPNIIVKKSFTERLRSSFLSFFKKRGDEVPSVPPDENILNKIEKKDKVKPWQ